MDIINVISSKIVMTNRGAWSSQTYGEWLIEHKHLEQNN